MWKALQTTFLLSLCASVLAGSTTQPKKTTVNVRIEGPNDTIFEGDVVIVPRNVTPISGPNWKCDATNRGGGSRVPLTTLTVAVDEAAKKGRFTWDGIWLPNDEEWIIAEIRGIREIMDRGGPEQAFWGQMINWRSVIRGGCAESVKDGDMVVVGWNQRRVLKVLRLIGSATKVKRGAPFVVTVVDEKFAVVPPPVVPGAVVRGVMTDANGTATLRFDVAGRYAIKADKGGSLRSQTIFVDVE